MDHINRQLAGAISWAPARPGACGLPTRGGAFGWHIGEDGNVDRLSEPQRQDSSALP